MAKSPAAISANKTPRKSAKTKAVEATAILETGADKHEITEEQRKADRRADEQVKTDAFAQFVAQGSGAAAPLQTPPAAKADFLKDMEALKAKYGVTDTVVVKPAKATKHQQNGITRPDAETICGKIWATADAISATMHGVCPVAALKEHKDIHGINDHTVKTQYAKWRKFNGVVGRLPKIHAVHQVQGEYDGMTPVAP